MKDAELAVDVLIVGAGVSGISAACHLRQKCPDKTFALIEARDAVGGTWDLFRYPGIRSDSDMHTFGFNFKPWNNAKAIADAPSILAYLQEAVEEYGIAKHICYGNKVTAAAWDSESSSWTLATAAGKSFRGQILFMCSGYYNYDRGYTPDIAGLDQFKGQLIHPQHWPDELDYAGKKVAVIGSGATAVTIVPSMADDAELVTMIQRSPTYVVSMPAKDRIANWMRAFLPDSWAYAITRWRNIRFQSFMYNRARRKPEKVKKQLLKMAVKEMGEEVVAEHFTPSYNPWDERLCLIPDSDLFNAIKAGKAAVVTDQIERVTGTGVLMKSGKEVEADILITATGLNLQMLGGVAFTKDGESIDITKTMYYQGMMFSGVPNLIQTFGYVNASWTLRADINSDFVCRLLQHFDETGTTQFVPTIDPDDKIVPETWLNDFNPGYIQRAEHLFPKQGAEPPWRNTQNYLLDKKLLSSGAVDDGVLRFH